VGGGLAIGSHTGTGGDRQSTSGNPQANGDRQFVDSPKWGQAIGCPKFESLSDVEIIIQRALEKHPKAKPRIISDNGRQFIA
jgi:hypothetical protein